MLCGATGMHWHAGCVSSSVCIGVGYIIVAARTKLSFVVMSPSDEHHHLLSTDPHRQKSKRGDPDRAVRLVEGDGSRTRECGGGLVEPMMGMRG